MAAPKRPLDEVDAYLPSPRRLRTSGPAADTCSPLPTTPECQVGETALLPTDVSVTTADPQPPQHETDSTVTNVTASISDNNVQAASPSEAQRTAPTQPSENQEAAPEIVEIDQTVPPADVNGNPAELAIVAADTVYDGSEGNEVIIGPEVVEEVQASGPAELKLRRIREAMKSLPNHLFIVSIENTFHGDTSAGVVATETTFDAAFEGVLEEAEPESYENYDTADEDSDNEFEDQGPERGDARLEWRTAQGNRERMIRIARINKRGSVTFDLVDDNGYDDNRLMITIDRRPVGARGNRQARLEL